MVEEIGSAEDPRCVSANNPANILVLGYALAMRALLPALCVGLFAITGCEDRSSRQQVESDLPASLATALTASELLDAVSPYYPRWNANRETLEGYVERYERTSEHALLKRVVAQALDDDAKWRAFLTGLRSVLPGYFIQDAAPPWDTIPSYQVVVGYEYPPGSGRDRNLVFRLSHFAPVFDYHESERDIDGSRTFFRQTPTPECAPIARRVALEIVRHFEHRHLAPSVGNTLVPQIRVGALLPGKVTLADALFSESPTW